MLQTPALLLSRISTYEDLVGVNGWVVFFFEKKERNGNNIAVQKVVILIFGKHTFRS